MYTYSHFSCSYTEAEFIKIVYEVREIDHPTAFWGVLLQQINSCYLASFIIKYDITYIISETSV